MLQGLDFGLDKTTSFKIAEDRASIMLDSVGMELIPMVTNLKGVIESWVDALGSLVGSCLSLLSGKYGTGLLPSTFRYRGLTIPFCLNPITDPLMSSDSFRIIHDGAWYSRNEKIREIGT